jgi:hypothetical protein
MKLIVPTSLYLFLSVVVWGIPDAWNTNTTYNKDDVVLYTPSGTSEAKNYIALQTGAGNQPDTSTAFWSLLDSVASSFSAPPGDPTTFSTPDTSSIPNETPPESDTSQTTIDVESVTPSGLPTASNASFIKQLYIDFLERNPDQGGFDFWRNALDNGATNRNLACDQFVSSDEFQNRIAPISRLYMAYFRRIPDTGGLINAISYSLIGNADNGNQPGSLNEISQIFADSLEFQNTYGSLNDDQFVELIYNNLFGRPSDPGGKQNALNAISGGLTRGEIMTAFSESEEYKTLISLEIRIISLYYGMLRRAPDQEGFDVWYNYLNGGASILELTQEFLDSSEYQNRF